MLEDLLDDFQPEALGELSEAVLDEEVAVAEPELPTLSHLIDTLADRVADRSCVGVAVVDASNLGSWERQNGAAAFALMMSKLSSTIRGLKGSGLRIDDIVCSEARAGDSIIVFLSEPRAGGAPIDFEEIVRRVALAIIEPFDTVRTRQAINLVTTGSALIIHNDSVDPRREIYRAIRKARADAAVTHHETQRRRHRVVGSVIARQRIDTFYQPIQRLSDRAVHGFEALSRAPEQEGRELGTHIFVAANKAELDGELDQTCRSLSVLRRPRLGTETKLFVNCLPPTFYEPMRDLEALLDDWKEAGLDPNQMVFELTEDITSEQLYRILPSIKRLRERGFLFALDDVGTGTANFQILADLEPAYIKMDITLTRGVAESTRKQALALHLLDYAKRTNAQMIAEGIENKADLDCVVDLGIPLGQGFLLGYPFPAEDQER